MKSLLLSVFAGGRSAADHFYQSGVDFVVIEPKPEQCSKLKEKGFLHIEGDATQEEDLFYHFKIIKEDDIEGLKILIIAIPKKNLEPIFENLKNLGLTLSAITTGSISIVNLHHFNKKFTFT